MQQDNLHPSDPTAGADCDPVWTVPCSDVQPGTPPPSYFSVLTGHDFGIQNQNPETTCCHLHCSHRSIPTYVDAVASDRQTIIIVSRARRQITCTGKKIGLFTLIILITLGLIISPLIWLLTRNPLIEKRTITNSDMRWEIPAPSYSSVITSQPPKLVQREDPTIVRNTVPVPPSVLARYSGTPCTTAASDNDDCCESCFRCCVIYSRMQSSPPISIYTQ